MKRVLAGAAWCAIAFAVAFPGHVRRECPPPPSAPLVITEADYPTPHPTQRLDVLMTGSDTTARCFMSYNGHGIYYDRATDTTTCEGAE